MINSFDNVANINREFLTKTKCTYTPHYYSAGGRAVALREILFVIPKNERISQMISNVRSISDDALSKEAKKQLPLWYPSIIAGGNHSLKEIQSFTGLIAIDFDAQDNPDLTPEQMKDKLSKYRFVAYAGLSVRGRGVYALIPLPSDAGDPERFKLYFYALEETFKNGGLIADSHCCNINRGRFLSFDSNGYTNTSAEIWRKTATPKIYTVQDMSPDLYGNTKADNDYQRTYNRIESIVSQCERNLIDPAPTGKDWFVVGRCLANTFGEDGRQFFLRLSSVWSRVNSRPQEEDPDKKYSFCLTYGGNPCSIGCLFRRAASVGVYAK